MRILQLLWESASAAASTRRDAFGLVALASIAAAMAGVYDLWILICAFFIPDLGAAASTLFKSVGPRVAIESQIALYPSLLIVVGLTGSVGTVSNVFLSAGAGWLLRIGIQRLVGADFLPTRENI